MILGDFVKVKVFFLQLLQFVECSHDLHGPGHLQTPQNGCELHFPLSTSFLYLALEKMTAECIRTFMQWFEENEMLKILIKYLLGEFTTTTRGTRCTCVLTVFILSFFC